MYSKYASLVRWAATALSLATLPFAAASAQQPIAPLPFHGQKTGTSVPSLLSPQVRLSVPRAQKAFRPVLNSRALSAADYDSLKLEANLHSRMKRSNSESNDIGLLAFSTDFLFSGPGSNANVDGGYVPLDCTMAVGPTTVVEPANVAISFYTKTLTTSKKGVPISANLTPYAIAQDFFNFMNYPHVLGVDPNGNTNFGDLSDPRVIYDEKTGHFLVTIIGIPYQSADSYWHSMLLIAVSQTSDATGVWWTYSMDLNKLVTPNPTTTAYLYDFPSSGIDDKNFYVTGTMFGWTQNDCLGATLISFDKAGLENGTGPAGFLWNGLNASLTPSKVLSQGPSKASYFVFAQPYSQNGDGSGNIGIYSLVGASNTGVAPILKHLPNVTVPYYEYPPTAFGPLGDQYDTLDARFQQKSLQIGDTLYAAHCIDDSGFPTVRGYQIDASTQTVTQKIDCWVSGTSNDFNPSIVANALGSAAINWDYTDPNIGTRNHPRHGTLESIRVLTLSGKTPWPAVARGELVPDSSSVKPYLAYRNGDYSSIQFDPMNPLVLWGINQNTLDYFAPQNWLFAVKSKK